MDWVSKKHVYYSEVVGAVRNVRTSDLLVFLGRVSAGMSEFEGFKPGWSQYSPWTISGIAREAIVSSNNSRNRELTKSRFIHMRNLITQVDTIPTADFDAFQLLVGIFHEQSSYQLSVKEEIARPMSVILETEIEFRTPKSREDLAELLGLPLEDLAYSTFILWQVARSHHGTITLDHITETWKLAPDRFPPLESIMAAFRRLTATIEEARMDALSAPQLKNGLQKYGYNPLTKTPFIDLDDGRYVAPQTQFILRSCYLENIFYIGQARWAKDFTSELGLRIEAYVGRLLREVGDHESYPEIVLEKGMKSTDWFLVTPAATVLIEVKSARSTLEIRSGSPLAAEELSKRLEVGYKQLSRSATRIRDGDPLFAHIPNDRPLVGLVVIAEPIHLVNFAEVRALLPTPELPIMTLSLRDFEELVTWPNDYLGEAVLKIATDPYLSMLDMWAAMKQGFPDSPQRDNPVINSSYERYLMWDAHDERPEDASAVF